METLLRVYGKTEFERQRAAIEYVHKLFSFSNAGRLDEMNYSDRAILWLKRVQLNASWFGSGSWIVSNLGIILLMIVVLVNVLLLL